MKTEIKILHEINTSEYFWCNSAVPFFVKNGKGTLTHSEGKEDSDYRYKSRLILNNKPIMQGDYPVCPTCTGMLAVGYGTENIDCPELTAVRECLNSAYTNIINSAKMIQPLLELLDDGYYLLADVPHMPTDSDGHFFYSIPNKLTGFSGVCDEYYSHEFITAVEGFPMFLYPTQSAKLINEQRVEHYTEIMKTSDNTPRALAYHEKGFFSALLDGHHKACAAARLGKKINCLTIIPVNSCTFADDYRIFKNKTLLKSLGFAGIKIPAPENMTYEDYVNSVHFHMDSNIEIEQYKLTGKKFPVEEENISKNYLPLRKISIITAAEIVPESATDNDISY